MFPALMPENPFTYESIESIGKAWSEEMVKKIFGGAYVCVTCITMCCVYYHTLTRTVSEVPIVFFCVQINL